MYCCIQVHKKDEFSKVILPATFGTSVYKSYQRNLHFWGFENIRKGPSKGVCSHPYFLRGRPPLLSKMRRVRAPSKGTEHEAEQASLEEARASEDLPLPAPPANQTTGSAAQVPPFIFAGASVPHRAVSPSLASRNSALGNSTLSADSAAASALSQSLTGLLDPSNNNNVSTTALLALLQQQHTQSNDQQQQQLTQILLLQHLKAQQEQQEQQRRLQELLSGAFGSNAAQQQQQGLNQGILAQALLAQLLQGGAPPPSAPPVSSPGTAATNNNGNTTNNLAFLASLLR